jgi:hypothetical protein
MVAIAVWAVPAGAAFHLVHVNEVMLSAGGNGGAQLVELADPSDEPFPDANGPYRLVVFDATGTRVGAQTVSTQLLRDRGSTPILLSTPAADGILGVTGDARLEVALPAAGEACFTSGSAETRVHCVTWGCAQSPDGPAPPDGRSLQRQAADESWQIAGPTPKAANAAGTTGAAGGDITKPRPALQLPDRRRLVAFVRSGLKFGITSSESGLVSVELTVDARTARRLRISDLIASKAADRTPASVRLQPSRRVGRKIAKLEELRVRITVVVEDAACNAGRLTRRFTLTR